MLYGHDLAALLVLVAAWATASVLATSMRGLLTSLATAGVAALFLSVQHLGRLSFYLDDQKAWPGTLLAVLPPLVLGVAVAVRRSLPPSWWVRAGLYSALALTAFELFPYGRLRAVDVVVPVAVTAAAVLIDVAVSRRLTGRLSRGAVMAAVAVLVLAGSSITAAATTPKPSLPDIPAVPVRTGRADTEGDSIYFEVRGSGPPLLLIAGGGGDGGYYDRIAGLLASSYEVITYDRRGNGRSSRHHATPFSLAQQARDAVAVLTAAGHDSALVMGSSGGALIGLQLVADRPAAVRKLVVHEAPLPFYDRRWGTFLNAVVGTRQRYGATAAVLQFTFGLGIPASALGATPAEAQSRGYDGDFVTGTELPGLLAGPPDVLRVRASGVPVICAVGELSRSQGRLQATGMPRLAADLHAPSVVFPGHHLSYQDDPAGWADALRSALTG